MFSRENALVFIYSILTILSGSLQAVAFKWIGYALKDYVFFVLLIVSFSFVPLFFIVVWFIMYAAGGFVKEAQSWAFKKHFVFIGLLNALNGILTLFSIPYVPGTTQAALAPVVIPFTLCLAILCLKSRFNWPMYIGASIVFFGCILQVMNTSDKGNSNLWWTVAFLIAQLPVAISSIYQEFAFTQGIRINVAYMMAWSSLSQFLALVLLIPVDFIPGFGNSTPHTFQKEIKNALSCVNNTLEGHLECQNAAFVLISCIVTMFCSSIFQALMVKHSSASTTVLVSTLITPTSSLCFMLHFLMGKHTEKMHCIQVVSLVIILIGISIYRYFDLATNRIEKLSDLDYENEDINSDLNRDRSTSVESASPQVPPLLISTRGGIINCEYTAADGRQTSILYEGTMWEKYEEDNSTQYQISDSLLN